MFNRKLEGWKIKPEKLLDTNDITDGELYSAHTAQKKILLDHVNSLTNTNFSNTDLYKFVSLAFFTSLVFSLISLCFTDISPFVLQISET